MGKSPHRCCGSLTAIDAGGAFVFVALTLLLLLGLLQPLNAHIKQLAAARQTTVRESHRHAELITAGQSLQREIENAQNEIAAAPLKILSEDGLNHRLADLSQLSSECGLLVEDLKPGDAVQTPHFLIIPVQMSGHGSYQSCAVFIHSLHQQLPDLDMRSFKLTGVPSDPQTKGTFEFQLGWYASPRGSTPQNIRTLTASLPQ